MYNATSKSIAPHFVKYFGCRTFAESLVIFSRNFNGNFRFPKILSFKHFKEGIWKLLLFWLFLHCTDYSGLVTTWFKNCVKTTFFFIQVVENMIEKFFHGPYRFTKTKQLVFFKEEDFWHKSFFLSCKQFLYISLYIKKQFQKFQGLNAKNTTFPEYFFQ